MTKVIEAHGMETTDCGLKVEISVNDKLCDEIINAENDSDLSRGMSMVARNRIMVALGSGRGLQYLTYGDDDNVDNVKARIRAAGEWLLRVANEAV